LKIIRKEGVLALYKGSLSPVMGVGAATSIQFGLNQFSQRLVANIWQAKELNFGMLYLCGMIAGAGNSIVSCLVEHIRIRMQI